MDGVGMANMECVYRGLRRPHQTHQTLPTKVEDDVLGDLGPL